MPFGAWFLWYPIYSLTNHTGDTMLVVIVHSVFLMLPSVFMTPMVCRLLIHEYRVMIEVV